MPALGAAEFDAACLEKRIERHAAQAASGELGHPFADRIDERPATGLSLSRRAPERVLGGGTSQGQKREAAKAKC